MTFSNKFDDNFSVIDDKSYLNYNASSNMLQRAQKLIRFSEENAETKEKRPLDEHGEAMSECE